MISFTKLANRTYSQSFQIRYIRSTNFKRRYGVDVPKCIPKKYQTMVSELRNGNRIALSKMITLAESTLDSDKEIASNIIEHLLNKRATEEKSEIKTFRLGLSGAPGVGKSTFIESFGLRLLNKGYKVAVLAVDPSSSRTGGSILGDKTRMIELSKRENAYVRPSPSRGSLGGVTSRTNEIILLLEEAKYDIILVETVGVGQSEIAVESMVDMFVLLTNPTAGDELQGIKKGIVEIADLVVVTKADGDLVPKARFTQFEYMTALKFVRQKSEKWHPKVLTCSSVTKEGIDTVWNTIHTYWKSMDELGEIQKKRQSQREDWMWKLFYEYVDQRIGSDIHIKESLPKIKEYVRKGEISPTSAANTLAKRLFSE